MADYSEIQRLLEKNRQDIGKRGAEIPGIYNKYAPSTDPEIAAARAAQADKVRELFAHDSQLAQTKFQPQAAPGATVSGAPPETPPEMILDPLIGLKAANTQTMATANEAIDIGQNIVKRKDFLGESLDKAMKLFMVGIEMKKAEREALSEEFDDLLKLDELALKREKKKSTESGSTDLQTLLKNIMQVKQTSKDITPQLTGVSKNGTDFAKIRKQYAEQEMDFEKLKDGSYKWAVRKPNQKFVSQDEANIYKDIPGLINLMGATTIANNPNVDRADVESILKKIVPTDDAYKSPAKRSVELQDKVYEAQAIINDLRKSYIPEAQVQAAITEIKQRAPELVGYIK